MDMRRFRRAHAQALDECWGKKGLTSVPVKNGWEITVVEQGLDRRWTVRRDRRKVAATFKLRPTWFDVRDREDADYVNALFECLGMADRVAFVKGGAIWYDGRGRRMVLEPETALEELPPTPPVQVWTDDGWRDAREVNG